MLLFPHGLHVDPRRQHLGDRRPRQGRQGSSGVQVQPRRQGADDARQGRRRRAAVRTSSTSRPPSLVAPNGDIFVADGHGGNTNARIVKFSQRRQVHQDLGQEGIGAGRIRHSARAGDGFAAAALFVADRQNNRIQIFDQDGKFLDQWTQFSRPSGIYIDKNDMIYVADSESESVSKNHDGWKRGIRIGSAQGRQGDGVHSRSGRARPPAPAPRKASPRTRWATSTAPRSARSG